jgi:biopolymer transport protein ExbD
VPTRPLTSDRRSALITGINITPLVDVVLVLLVVLMVVSTYIVTQSMKVDLPKASTKDAAKGDPLTLTIYTDGRLLLDAQPIVPNQLGPALVSAFQAEPDRAMVISADRMVPHGTVVEFVDLARKSGATRFAIKVEDPNPVAPSR